MLGDKRACFLVFFFILVLCGPGQGWLGSVRLFIFQGGNNRWARRFLRRGGGRAKSSAALWLRLERDGIARESSIDNVMQLVYSLSVPDSTTRVREGRQQIYEMTTTRIWNLCMTRRRR
ncbi:hypothetical protein B0T18DRAFT_23283 [Schizothecium vesticola]|uniref:Secreted protein n=1 Tax=Schizothecium vesticola TaxID=314040 RepID=A0AA40F9W5_9PEZI|nr:hypothetical protein B0T18DRAFT_23283 [Schizothecium vesticola]